MLSVHPTDFRGGGKSGGRESNFIQDTDTSSMTFGARAGPNSSDTCWCIDSSSSRHEALIGWAVSSMAIISRSGFDRRYCGDFCLYHLR